jgi:GGDEF domain-containing protein
MILPNCQEEQARDIYIDRLNAEIKRHGENITISIGIVQTGPIEYGESDMLIHEADNRMYVAKKNFKAKI